MSEFIFPHFWCCFLQNWYFFGIHYLFDNNFVDRVVNWAQGKASITSTAFSPDGSMCVSGHYDGTVVFYHTERLKYYTQIECRNRRGTYKEGRKVCHFT